MDKESDAPESKVEPPATDATQNNLSISAEEARKEVPKLDSTLNNLHILEKKDQPSEEIPTTKGGFVTHEKPGVDGEGDVYGK